MTPIAIKILSIILFLLMLVLIRKQTLMIDDIRFVSKTNRSRRITAECGKEQAYRERNHLVRVLTRLYDAHLYRHPEDDKNWDNDWRWIVCVHTPAGQATWHIHDSEVSSFQHLAIRPNDWDGHSSEEKYARLDSLRSGHRTSGKSLNRN